jgi:hypothetical protein
MYMKTIIRDYPRDCRKHQKSNFGYDLSWILPNYTAFYQQDVWGGGIEGVFLIQFS